MEMKIFCIHCSDEIHRIGITSLGTIELLDCDHDEEETREHLDDAPSQCYLIAQQALEDPSNLLEKATRVDGLELAKLCIEAGADVHYQNEKPLTNAVFRRNLDIVKILLNSGANPNIITFTLIHDKIPLLSFARLYSSPEIVSALVGAGAEEQ